MASTSIECSVPGCSFRTPHLPERFYPNMVDQLKLHQWSSHNGGNLGNLIWSTPNAPMAFNMQLQLKSSDPVHGSAVTPIKKTGGQEMVTASMEKRKKKKTENKVGEEVGRLMEKGKEMQDKNRMRTGTMGMEEMMVDEEGNRADQDGGDGGVMVGQGRGLNQDQPTREKRDEVMEYPCPNCYNMFPSVEILTNHFKNCYVINPEFKASNEMAKLKGGVKQKSVHGGKAGEGVTNGKSVSANPFDCGACGKVHHSMAELKLHQQTCLSDKFPCHQCGKIFYSLVGLRIHNSKYCKEDIDKEEVEMMEDESSDPTWEMSTKKDRPKVKLFKCPEIDCKVKMKSKSALKQHIAFVHGSKTINCPESECKAKLKSKSTLKQHIDFVHGDGERRFPCKVPSCQRRFSRSSHIPDHMRASHGAPKLQCDVCERKFNGATHMNRHMRNVHKIEPELKQAVLKN